MSRDKTSVSQWFVLTNTPDGPSSGMPQNPDDQVMYYPSVEEIDCLLIESAVESIDSDLDNGVFHEPFQLEEAPTLFSLIY